MLRGGEELFQGLCQKLNVTAGHRTSDGQVTLEFAECLGACEQAPCILVNEDLHGNLDEGKALEAIKK